MPQTIYASFPTAGLCEQAAGALLDYGVRKEDVSVVAPYESWQNNVAAPLRPGAATETAYSGTSHDWRARVQCGRLRRRCVAETGDRLAGAVTGAVGASNAAAGFEQAADERSVSDAGYRGGETRIESGAVLRSPTDSGYTDTDRISPSSDVAYVNDQNRVTAAHDDADRSPDIDGSAKQGISVTTPGDAGAGAAKGAGWGLGLGALAAIASLAIPGFGLVLGGGALATAIAGAVGTTVAGAAAGGVVGYLKDQGVPDEVAANYDQAIQSGGAMLAVIVPSNDVDSVAAEQVLRKYGATNINSY